MLMGSHDDPFSPSKVAFSPIHLPHDDPDLDSVTCNSSSSTIFHPVPLNYLGHSKYSSSSSIKLRRSSSGGELCAIAPGECTISVGSAGKRRTHKDRDRDRDGKDKYRKVRSMSVRSHTRSLSGSTGGGGGYCTCKALLFGRSGGSRDGEPCKRCEKNIGTRGHRKDGKTILSFLVNSHRNSLDLGDQRGSGLGLDFDSLSLSEQTQSIPSHQGRLSSLPVYSPFNQTSPIHITPSVATSHPISPASSSGNSIQTPPTTIHTSTIFSSINAANSNLTSPTYDEPTNAVACGTATTLSSTAMTPPPVPVCAVSLQGPSTTGETSQHQQQQLIFANGSPAQRTFSFQHHHHHLSHPLHPSTTTMMSTSSSS